MSFVVRLTHTDEGMHIDPIGEYVYFSSYFFLRELLGKYRDELEKAEVEMAVMKQKIQKLSVSNH